MASSFCRRSFLNYKNCLFQTQKRTGYVVLIPETPKEVAECNVTSLENLPNFSELNSESCKQIVHKYAQKYNTGTWELDEHLQKKLKESDKIDAFKNIIEPLEVLSVPFQSAWGVAKTLYTANQKLMPLTTFYPISDRVLQIRNDRFSIESFYHVCKKCLENSSEKYTNEQKRILKKFIWEGIHSGFELTEKKKQELKLHCSEIEIKKGLYENKYRNSKYLFKQVIMEPDFATDAPIDFLRETAVHPETPEKGPWIITLKDFVYWKYLEICNSREARRHLWLNYNQLASVKMDVRCNATTEVEEIRKKRKLIAKVLGYPTYTHFCMETKMAGSLENVQNVLSTLLEPAKCAQEMEIFELEKFVYLYNFKHRIELWDLPYCMKLERYHKMGLDEKILRDYFPFNQVLLGLIALSEQLFGIVIEEQESVKAWHPDVRYFRVSDAKTKNMLGGFYLDPYWRSGKLMDEENNGFFVTMRPRSRICASLPLSSLIFKFDPPTDDRPSLLYYREVEALFDKFANMLQFTLSQMNYSEVSGISNIEWDAVEICSNFLKSWLSEKGTLESISGHYDTGEPLPPKLLNNLCKLHKQMAGTKLCKDIYFANLDLQIHLREDDIMKIVDDLWPEHLLFEIQKLDYHPFGFKDIFARPWGSSYYSHIWSKMVATDAYSAFMEAGFHNHEEIARIGKRFRSTFLASGGGQDASEIFKAFRGRDPNPNKLTEFLSLNKPTTATPNLEPELAPNLA